MTSVARVLCLCGALALAVPVFGSGISAADDVSIAVDGARTSSTNVEDLPEDISVRVSPEALALARSPELADAQASWDSDQYFVWQVHYQLVFRAEVDYLPVDPESIAALLEAKPKNFGIELLGLYLTDGEVAELQRRTEVGDRLPELALELGAGDALDELSNARYPDTYAGVWQDQLEGVRLVVATTDLSSVDRSRLAEIAGGEDILKLIEVKYSWSEVESFSDRLNEAIAKDGIVGTVIIESLGDGRQLQIITPTPERITTKITEIVPEELLLPTVEGEFGEQGNPSETHPEIEQQPGLQIRFDSNLENCTWGANGHTTAFAYHYVVTAGHCGANQNVQNWSTDEVRQNGSYLLTSGQQWVHTINNNDWDMQRISSPQADTNCYHFINSCSRVIYGVTNHNWWEVNSDRVCASLGTTNATLCGLVTQENYSPGAPCGSGRLVRYNIDTTDGDSGSGLIWPVGAGGNNAASSIDAIHHCGVGTTAAGNTAADVSDQLTFEFNCATTFRGNMSPTSWGSCANINR